MCWVNEVALGGTHVGRKRDGFRQQLRFRQLMQRQPDGTFVLAQRGGDRGDGCIIRKITMTPDEIKKKYQGQATIRASGLAHAVPSLSPRQNFREGVVLSRSPTTRAMSIRKMLENREVRPRANISNYVMRQGIDNGTFPAPIVVGARSHRWFEDEIDAWLEARLAERDRFVRERAQRMELARREAKEMARREEAAHKQQDETRPAETGQERRQTEESAA